MMRELKCPNCGKTFTVDKAGYAAILSQVKNKEFDRELEKRLHDMAEAQKANRDKVRKVQAQLGGKPVPKMRTKKSYMQICEEKGWEIGVCPHCKCQMRVIEILEPSWAPPSKGTSSRSACL